MPVDMLIGPCPRWLSFVLPSQGPSTNQPPVGRFFISAPASPHVRARPRWRSLFPSKSHSPNQTPIGRFFIPTLVGARARPRPPCASTGRRNRGGFEVLGVCARCSVVRDRTTRFRTAPDPTGPARPTDARAAEQVKKYDRIRR